PSRRRTGARLRVYPLPMAVARLRSQPRHREPPSRSLLSGGRVMTRLAESSAESSQTNLGVSVDVSKMPADLSMVSMVLRYAHTLRRFVCVKILPVEEGLPLPAREDAGEGIEDDAARLRPLLDVEDLLRGVP